MAISDLRDDGPFEMAHGFDDPRKDAACKPPAEVRHEWYRNRERGAGVYECPHCKMWTANVPLYFNDICEARDRRKTPDRRRGNHG